MVFGIDPIYIMLISILAMAVGFAGFGMLLFRMYQVLVQMRDHLGLMTNPRVPALPPAKQGAGHPFSASELIDLLSRTDPVKHPLQVQHYAKQLTEEMVHVQQYASAETVMYTPV